MKVGIYSLNINPHCVNQTTIIKQETHTMKLVAKDIIHPKHPQHKLTMNYSESPFNCDGCKEAGIGLAYRCSACDFDLHKVCTIGPLTTSLPFYPKCEFRLISRPPGQLPRACDACRKIVRGSVYHCYSCGFDLHPCCANLPKCLDDKDRKFYLCSKISCSCLWCGGKGLGWSYQSDCRKYGLHVACVKELVVESWESMFVGSERKKVVKDVMRIPGIRGAMQGGRDRKGRTGRVEKCCQIAGSAVRVIVSAILGDPTAIIAGVIGGILYKS